MPKTWKLSGVCKVFHLDKLYRKTQTGFAKSKKNSFEERWLSGQKHLTVNQTTFVYVGSNPTLSMILGPFRLVVRTLPFRGKGTGSIPVRGIAVLMKIMTERSAVR